MMKRDSNIDFLKGFAILLMVMGHYLAGSISGIEDCGPHSWSLGALIYSFHMPLFFLLSGLLCGKKGPVVGSESMLRVLVNEILHKAKTLLLPGFTFMVIGYLIGEGNRFEMAWFLKVLFQIWLVFLMVQFVAGKFRLSLKSEVVLHILVFVAWFCSSHLTKGSFVYERLWFHGAAARYPYFVLGYVIPKLNLEKKYRNGNWLFTVALIVYIGSYISTIYGLSGKVASYMSCYITAPAASIYCLYVGKRVLTQFGNSKWYKATCYLGQKTLAIYLLHGYFIIVTPTLARIWANMSWGASVCFQLFISLFASTLSIIICLMVEYIIQVSQVNEI